MSEYPGLIERPKPKTMKEWAEWWEGFRKRNGLDKPMPSPRPDAPAPPPHHSETERDEEPTP